MWPEQFLPAAGIRLPAPTTHLHGPTLAQGSWDTLLAAEHPMGPPCFLPGAWELSQVVAQDKPKAKCLIGKIVAQQVSDVHNSINRL